MKIDSGILFKTSGISCLRVTRDPNTGGYDSHEATAAFVTRESVKKARTALRASGGGSAVGPDVRYGDILVSWVGRDGKSSGMRAPAGMDAGIQIEVARKGASAIIPFTGGSMFSAKANLEMKKQEADLNEDQKRVLSGISGVIDVVLADPDPDRFNDDLIGRAFSSVMIGDVSGVSMPVTCAEFGRKARSDLLKARIAMIDPRNKDALISSATLHGVVDAALGYKGAIGGQITSPSGDAIDEAQMRKTVLSSDRMTREIFGSMTTRDVSRIPASPIPTEDFDNLCAHLEDKRLSGAWVEGVQGRLQEITREIIPDYDCQVSLFCVEGLDVLAIRDSEAETIGAGYVYSWPTSERIPVSLIGDEQILNLSPEEIPTSSDIDRLERVYELLAHGPASESGMDILSMIAREEDLA